MLGLKYIFPNIVSVVFPDTVTLFQLLRKYEPGPP